MQDQSYIQDAEEFRDCNELPFKLYPYQQGIIDKAQNQSAFLNGSDMGTGKTVVAVREIWDSRGQLNHFGSQKVLVVAPNNARDIWIKTFARETDYPVTNLDRKDREGSFNEWLSKGGVLVVHWEAVGLRRKQIKDPTTGAVVRIVEVPLMPELFQVDWDYVIADEAHKVKNRKALRSKGLKRLKTRAKRAETGTLIINRPDDAWSILNWLYPQHYKSYWRFFEEHVLYTIDRFGYRQVHGVKNAAAFRKEIEPFSAFISKEEASPFLPKRYYTTRTVQLDTQQRKAYNEMKKASLTLIGEAPDDMPLAAPTILAQLTRLRQFACAFAEFDENGKVKMSEPSAKLDALMDIVEESGDSKVVVFTQFAQMVTLAHARLSEAGIKAVTFYGATDDAGRIHALHDFRENPNVKVFLATMQTGGTGVDGLQHASSTVVFLDRSWSPAENDQAESRLHRDGQRLPVQVILIQAEKTVDEVVEDRLTLKRAWMLQMLGSH